MKKQSLKKIFNISFWLLLLVVIFTPDLRTEVFGFIQQGVLRTGILQPKIERKKTDIRKADYNLEAWSSSGQKLEMNELKGKVIFINFWATWCPPCVAEMPGIHTLYQSLKTDREIVFLMISMDKDFSKAISFKEKKELDFEIYEPLKIPEIYDSGSLPTTIVINAAGEIVLEHTGMANYNTKKFRKFLESLK